MDNVVFSATTRNGKYTFKVEDGGEKYTKDRFSIETNFGVDYADTPNQILGQLVMESEWKEGTFEKILVDELGIGKEYLQIVKMIRAKYNWLEKLPKGSEGRIFYFEIGRYFRNGLYKNVPSDKIFKMIDDYIATSNFREDVKSEKKTLKESVKEIPYDGDYEGSPLWKIEIDSFGKCEDDVTDDLYEKISSHLDIYDVVDYGKTIEVVLDNPSDKEKKWILDYFNSKEWKNKESMYESTKSEKKTLKESAKSESIVAKLSKEFLGYNVGIVSEADGIVEDSITVGIDSGFGENRDKNKPRNIYNYVAKELRGYSDTKVTYDSASEMCIIDFYNVSSYSDRELVQTIEDIVWNVNAKFDIKEV